MLRPTGGRTPNNGGVEGRAWDPVGVNPSVLEGGCHMVLEADCPSVPAADFPSVLEEVNLLGLLVEQSFGPGSGQSFGPGGGQSFGPRGGRSFGPACQ